MSFDTERMDQRMRNWGRYCAGDSGGGVGTCASAERFYVAPKADEQRMDRHAVEPVDVLDAELVERAVTRIMPGRERKFAVFFYVRRFDRGLVCRRLRLGCNCGARDHRHHHDGERNGRHVTRCEMFEAFRRRVLGAVHDRLLHLEAEPVSLIRKGKPLWAGVARITKAGV